MAEDSERRCVVRRARAHPEELVRLVAGPDGLLHVDYRARLPGRGAWITPERACVEELERKPGLARQALGVDVRAEGLLGRLREANLRAVGELLALAARSGALAGGKEAVREALGHPTTLALLLASDASPRLVEDLKSRAPELPTFVLPLDTVALGHQIGRGMRAALVLRRGSLGERLLVELQRQAALR